MSDTDINDFLEGIEGSISSRLRKLQEDTLGLYKEYSGNLASDIGRVKAILDRLVDSKEEADRIIAGFERLVPGEMLLTSLAPGQLVSGQQSTGELAARPVSKPTRQRRESRVEQRRQGSMAEIVDYAAEHGEVTYAYALSLGVKRGTVSSTFNRYVNDGLLTRTSRGVYKPTEKAMERFGESTIPELSLQARLMKAQLTQRQILWRPEL